MNQIFSFIVRKKNVFILISLLVIVFLSYGKTLQMYFWVDDWAMTYKVLWPEEAPGNMGSGIYGNGGPYRYLVTPFIWLYPFFGFEAMPYFAIGIFLYFIASVSVYFLAKELSKNYLVAFGASAIFASGYIGSHALYRLTNSYQTVGAALFVCLTVLLYAKYLRERKPIFFWTSLSLYIISIEVFFIRTHGLLLSLFGVSIYYFIRNIYKEDVKSLLLRLLPFIFVFYYMYFLDPRIITQSKLVLMGIEALKRGEISLINNFFITIANSLIPEQITQFVYQKLLNLATKQILIEKDVFSLLGLSSIFFGISIFAIGINKVKKYRKLLTLSFLAIALLFSFVLWSIYEISPLWNPRGIDLFSSLLGALLIHLFLFITILRIKNKQPSALLIPLSLFWIIVNSITLFIYSPETNLESTSRYLVPSFAGIGILYASTFLFIKNKRIGIVLTILVSATLIYYSNKEADQLLVNVSIPDKQGYALIKQEVSKVDESTIFYIESADDPRFKNTYLGRLPQLGISSLFKYHGITNLAESYEHLFLEISNGKYRLEDVHTYFFGIGGYQSTTQKLRALLVDGGDTMQINKWSSSLNPNLISLPVNSKTVVAKYEDNVGSLGVNPTLEAEFTYDSLVPARLNITMSVSQLKEERIVFPYYDVTALYSINHGPSNIGKIKPLKTSETLNQVILALEDEEKIDSFRRYAKVSTTSHWKSTEPNYIVDGNTHTNWGANNTDWNYGSIPQDILLDLGWAQDVSRLTWINHHLQNTPTSYKIYFSNDKIHWENLIEREDRVGKDSGVWTSEIFTQSVRARYIKMSIFNTFGGRGYPPSIKEIWVINSGNTFDSKVKDTILACPFCSVNDAKSYRYIASLLRDAKIRVSWTTDRGDTYATSYSQDIKIKTDGNKYTYTTYIPAQGTKFKKLKLDNLNIPFEMSIENVTIKSLSLEEIKRVDLYDRGD